jgi:hypothetical protein
MANPEFRLEASFDEKTGRATGVYLRVRRGEVKETREMEDGVVYADYDTAGQLLGVELLGPCDVEVLAKIADNEPEAVREFLKSSPPRGLIVKDVSPAGIER